MDLNDVSLGSELYTWSKGLFEWQSHIERERKEKEREEKERREKQEKEEKEKEKKRKENEIERYIKYSNLSST